LRRASPHQPRVRLRAQLFFRSVRRCKKPLGGLPARPAPSEERIGVVTHYYSHLSAATLRLESGTLRVGDVIHIRGHTTDFSQSVESLEVNHVPATEVGPNDDFGLKVVQHAREHDVVYKVRRGRSRRAGRPSAKIPRIGLSWHEASTEEAVIYLGADLSCRQNATHSRDIDRLLNHPLGRPCP
jgi:hypothetical protein